MNWIKKIVFEHLTTLLLVLATSAATQAQTPSTDPSWQLEWQDDFNTLDLSSWLVENNFDHYAGGGVSEQQVYTNRAENVSVLDGNLLIKANREAYSCPLNTYGCSLQNQSSQPYQFTSGWIETKPILYKKYGYIETRALIPFGKGLWPAFWTFKEDGGANSAEIDIFEMRDGLAQNKNYLSTNVHLEYCPQNSSCNIPNNAQVHYPVNFDYTTWHKYGIAWTPSKIIWYLDDVPIRELNNHGVTDYVRVILNLAIDAQSQPDVTTPFPAELRFDYVKFYSLINDCDTDLIACSYNLNSHDNKVKKTITIGGSGCSNYLLTGNNISLRATDSITINGEFYIPLGSEANIIVEPCY